MRATVLAVEFIRNERLTWVVANILVYEVLHILFELSHLEAKILIFLFQNTILLINPFHLQLPSISRSLSINSILYHQNYILLLLLCQILKIWVGQLWRFIRFQKFLKVLVILDSFTFLNHLWIFRNQLIYSIKLFGLMDKFLLLHHIISWRHLF